MCSRTAAVYFSNGTTAPVAKIEGSNAYKTEMRRLQSENEISQANWREASWANRREMLKQKKRSAQQAGVPPVFESWQRALKAYLPWSHAAEAAQRSGLEQMLHELKIPTERYLEHSFEFVEISVPTIPPLGDGEQTHLISSALQKLNLQCLDQTPMRATEAAAFANGIGYLPWDGGSLEREFVLYVNYELGGVRIEIDVLDCKPPWELTNQWKYFETGEVLRDELFWGDLESRLTKGVSVVEEGARWWIVLSGDQVVADQRLFKIVKKALEGREVLNDSVNMNLGNDASSIDPIFAAALGVARKWKRDNCWLPYSLDEDTITQDLDFPRDEL